MPTAYERLEHAGGAVQTTLTGDHSSGIATITIDDASGWPTGSTGPFYITIDPGEVAEERVQILSRSGTVLTVASSGRGVDGTTAVAHSNGVVVIHSDSGIEAAEANYAVTQTVGKVTTSQDLLVASGANAFSRLGVGAAGTVLRVAAGVIGWAQVTAADIATSVAGAGLTGGNGTPLAVVVDDVTIELPADTLQVKDRGITYDVIQEVSATDRILGRDTAGSGSMEELTLGDGLAFTGSGGIEVPDNGIAAIKVTAETWTSYTPTIAQGASSNVAKTTHYARYIQYGKTVIAQGRVTTTATASSGIITVSIPVTAATSSTVFPVGEMLLGHTAASNVFVGVACLTSTGVIHGTMHNASGGVLGNNAPAAHVLENGDQISWSITYEAA